MSWYSRKQMEEWDIRSICGVVIALCPIFLYIFVHIINADAVKQTKNMREYNVMAHINHLEKNKKD
jgi:succinate dehydrogenase hydrophobic anchor subunit